MTERYQTGRASVALLVFLLAFAWAGAAHGESLAPSEAHGQAEPPAVSVSAAEAAGRLEREVKANWLLYRRAFDARDLDRAAEVLQDFTKLRGDYGIGNLTTVANALLHDAGTLVEEGDGENARNWIGFAKELAPDRPGVEFARARIEWGLAPQFFWRPVSAWIEGARLGFGQFDECVATSGKLIGLLLAVLWIGAGFFAFTFPWRYGRLLYHDVNKHLLAGVPSLLKPPVFLIGIFIPVILGLGLVWLFVYWMLIFWIYAQQRERVFTFLFLAALVFAAPLVSAQVALLSAFERGSVFAEIERAEVDLWTPRSVEVLRGALAEDPDDLQAGLALGRVLRLSGAYNDAERVYLALLSRHPNWLAGRVNLANVHYGLGDPYRAEALYKSALEIDPDNAKVHYNLSKAYGAQTESELMSHYYDLALELDPSISELTDEAREHFVIDFPVTTSELWKRVFDPQDTLERAERAKAADELWSHYLRGVPRPVAPYLILILLFGLVFSTSLRRRLTTVRRCPRCGRPMCLRCQERGVATGMCAQCYHVFIRREKVDPSVRARKERRIRSYHHRRDRAHRLVSLVVPGFGHLLRGSTALGVFFLFGTVGWFLLLHVWHGIGTGSWALPHPGGVPIASLGGVPWLLCATAWYAVVQADIHRRT